MSRVRVTCTATGLNQEFLLAPDAPSSSGGVGGYEEVARPKNSAMSRWTGRPLAQLTLPLMLDGYVDEESVEAEVDALLELGRDSDDPTTPSQVVSLDGPLVWADHVPEWAVVDVQLGTSVYENDVLLRQPVTLVLLEHVPADLIEITPGMPGTGAAKRKKKRKVYVVKKGDTLKKIASKMYGKKARKEMPDLKKDNAIRDPNKQLKPGRKIKL